MLRPATPADLDALVALFAAYDVIELGAVEMEATDLQAMLVDETSEGVVAVEGDRVLGFADISESGEAETVADPGGPDPTGLQRELLAWLLERARAKGITRLEHYAGGRPDGAGALLAEAGFAHVRTQWRMVRALNGESAEPVWPDGVTLRAYDAARDAREVWSLIMRAFAGTFGSHQRTFEQWSLFAVGPGKDAICVVEDRALIAVATVSPRGDSGYIGQLAVAPEHRGRGLALALLHEAFRRDAAAGLPETSLSVDGENAGARRLYEKAGMHVDREYRRWERDV